GERAVRKIDIDEYRQIFLPHTEKALQLAHDIRKFEIDLYWKTSNIFLDIYSCDICRILCDTSRQRFRERLCSDLPWVFVFFGLVLCQQRERRLAKKLGKACRPTRRWGYRAAL